MLAEGVEEIGKGNRGNPLYKKHGNLFELADSKKGSRELFGVMEKVENKFSTSRFCALQVQRHLQFAKQFKKIADKHAQIPKKGSFAQAQSMVINMAMRGITTICGSPEDETTWIYRINESGIYVREANIESVTPNREKTTIVQITDVHLNWTNAEDEADEEIRYTKQCRTWNADGISVKALKNAMQYAAQYDRTVITGDTLDYLSCGAMELMQKYIWDVDPYCIVTLGGHDVTKQMQTKRPNKLPLSERQAILEKFWRHNMYYFSEVIHDNVMLIQLDNGCHTYWEFQIPKLAKDLKKARENGYTVLLFQHEPICTGRPADKELPSFYVWADNEPYANFYDICIGYEPESDAPTMELYRMITGNADIIRGIFCGHEHTGFYMEVEGSYTDKDGMVHRKTIPQYLLECNVYEGYTGHVLKITV